MVLGGLLIASLYTSFRPLTGMVLHHRKGGFVMSGFRPLAGIVLAPLLPTFLIPCFRPLAGISCNEEKVNAYRENKRFSSPRRDFISVL